MAKPVAVNPKLTLIRKALAKCRPALLRGVGVQAKVQVNPSTAEAELAKLEAQLQAILTGMLNATGLPVRRHDEPLPQAGWVFQPLSGQRNAKHGNLCCGPALGYVQDGKLGAFGLLLAEAEDSVVAAAGEGTLHDALGRLRVSARALRDAVVQLPMSSLDTATLRLMEHGDTVPFHTRKTGNVLADALRVAAGQADGAVATRLSSLEALAIELMVKEAGGSVKRFTTHAGETLVSGNIKLLAELSALLPG
jgi:fructose-1,6-bisphosphatase/inositol monophosphatase family enzyme